MQFRKLIKRRGFIIYLPRLILQRNNTISTVVGNQYLPRFFYPFRKKMEQKLGNKTPNPKYN